MRPLFSRDMKNKRYFFRGLVALGFCVLYTFWGFVGYFQTPGTFQSQFFIISEGDSLKTISAGLEKEGLISSALLFRCGLFLSGKGRLLKSGDYFIAEKETPYGIAHLLLSAQGQQHKVTIPEGLTNYQVLELLKEKAFLKNDNPVLPPEGMLYPETYIFSRGTTFSRVIAEMKHMMELKILELWSHRKANLPFQTPEEALVLASIVEKEAFVDAEKPIIAGVYLNRLAIGMPLQADPTVIYGLSEGRGDLGRLLVRSDLTADHPFNTYRIKGLPPAPIANPSLNSLKAVLMHPEETDALYFVADGTGGHQFSKHYHHHQKHVGTLQKIRQQQRQK